MLTLNDFVSISFVDFSQFFLQWIWIFSLIPACCFTPLYNIHTKSKNFSSILRTVESILPSLWIKRSSWDKKILTLGILYYQLLKSINQIKKRTRRNSECQKTSFVRFLYLGLDFSPGLSQTHLHVPQFDTIVLNLTNGESSIQALQEVYCNNLLFLCSFQMMGKEGFLLLDCHINMVTTTTSFLKERVQNQDFFLFNTLRKLKSTPHRHCLTVEMSRLGKTQFEKKVQ